MKVSRGRGKRVHGFVVQPVSTFSVDVTQLCA
jgi:hypothetical protein